MRCVAAATLRCCLLQQCRTDAAVVAANGQVKARVDATLFDCLYNDGGVLTLMLVYAVVWLLVGLVRAHVKNASHLSTAQLLAADADVQCAAWLLGTYVWMAAIVTSSAV